MNTLIPIGVRLLVVSAVAGLLNVSPLAAQTARSGSIQLSQAPAPPPPTDPDFPAPSGKAAAASTSARSAEAVRRQIENTRRELELSVDKNENYQQLQKQLSKMESAVANDGFGRMSSAGGEQRNLIIRSSDTDAKSIAATKEDLSVMGRILTKALAADGPEDRKAMGIPIRLIQNGVRNLQIEGYGVVFLLQADFPLIGPPAETSEEKPKESTNSVWDETKRELYGSRENTVHWAGPKVEYDPKRVEDLKRSILEALKNASNIRGLKDGDSVTVVVTSGDDGSSGSSSGYVVSRATSGDGASASVFTSGGGSVGSSEQRRWESPRLFSDVIARGKISGSSGSTLTIRAKKSDIDAFFKERLNLDEFRKKATVTLY